MPLDLQKIQAATKFTVVPFGEIGELQIEYRPAVIGDATCRDLLRQAEQTENSDEIKKLFATQFVRLVAWWDLYDGGKPVPLTIESVSGLSMVVLHAVFLHTSADMGKPPQPSVKSEQRI